MSYPLAIFAPTIGARSETFIRRHMQELLPGGTVVVSIHDEQPYAGYWHVDCPTLLLKSFRYAGPKRQLAQNLVHRLSLGTLHLETIVVKRFLRKHGVQIILTEWLDHSLPWLQVAKELGIRLFGHAHGYDVSARFLSNPYRKTEYAKYNQADGVITMSQVSQARLITLGLDAHKLHVIPYGVNIPTAPMQRPEPELIRCVAVGRMVTKKAPILTLDTFRRAAELCPNLRLDYVGDGPLFPASQQFVQALHLEDRVTLHGAQSSEMVQKLLQEADIFLQHSMTALDTGDEEGLPVAILEAMAQSLPVISTLHAGIPEAVLNGTTGYLVEEGDSTAMAERLVTLARNPQLRHQMGKAGWHRTKERFSWEKERSDLLKVLQLPLK